MDLFNRFGKLCKNILIIESNYRDFLMITEVNEGPYFIHRACRETYVADRRQTHKILDRR